MPNVRQAKLTFAGGEIAPEMYGRIDDRAYQNGAARIRNTLTKPQGIARRRPGMRLVREVKDSTKVTRLIPFRYSTTQALQIEFGEGYMRFHQDGGTVLYAEPRTVLSVDFDDDLLVFAAPHRFVTGQELRFTISAGGTAPTGITPLTTTYTLTVVDPYRISLDGTSLSGTLVGTLRAWLEAEWHPDWSPRQDIPVANVNPVDDQFLAIGHKFVTAQPILFSSTGTLPPRFTGSPGGTPLTPLLTYYAIRVDANNFAIADTAALALAGTRIDLIGLGTPGTVPTGSGHLGHSAFGVYAIGDIRLLSNGRFYQSRRDGTSGDPITETNLWTLLPEDGIYEVASPYSEEDLREVTFAQSNDVMKFAHRGYPLHDLRRYGANTWTMQPAALSPQLPAPTGLVFFANRGQSLSIEAWTVTTQGVEFVFRSEHDFGPNDTFYLFGSQILNIPDGFYSVRDPDPPIGTVPPGRRIVVQQTTGAVFFGNPPIVIGSSQLNIEGMLASPASLSSDATSTYVITAVDNLGVESPSSAPLEIINNLNVSGSYNVLAWLTVVGAVAYRIYKFQSGLYGFIGQTEDGIPGFPSTNFRDDNIAPDLGDTVPRVDTVFASTGNYPGAVGYFEQRLVAGGTDAEPNGLWLTRSGTEGDFSYHLPLQDDDRIAISVASREAQVIIHAVNLGELLLLTNAGEWRVTTINSEAITPSTAAIRFQGGTGSSFVSPIIVNNNLVFCAARGGHVRELGFSFQSQGFITGDLSIRAVHLFDDSEILDMAFSKSPFPVLWFTSTSGELLSFTYVPEEQVGAWHHHTTDGTFESVSVIPEGEEDILYAIVARENDAGGTKRYVERMAIQQPGKVIDAYFVDSGLTYDGRGTKTWSVVVSGGSQWEHGDIVTVTASSPLFYGPAHEGSRIVIEHSDGTSSSVDVLFVISPTQASGVLRGAYSKDFLQLAETNWSFAIRRFEGLSHLEGKTVQILANGVVNPDQVVVDGAITLDEPASVVHAGLPFVSEVQTLPAIVNIDGYGLGRAKAVNKVWVRMIETAGITAGITADSQVAVGDAVEPSTGEVQSTLLPGWTQDAQILIRQTQPLPATIVSMTMELAIGG